MGRTIRRSVLAALLALLAPAIAAGQQQEFEDAPVDPADLDTTIIVGALIAGVLITVVIAAVFIHLLTRYTRSANGYVREESIETGLIGLGVVVGGFILAIGLAITGIGIIVSLPLLFALMIAMIFGNVLFEIVLGLEIIRALRDDEIESASTATLWKGFLLGFVVLIVLNLVPFVNFLVGLIAMSLGVGLLVQFVRKGAHPGGDAGGSASGVSESW